ncbi:MAG: hypothetical protein ACLPUT_17865 [Solirubrobacteraceae bacterium]
MNFDISRLRRSDRIIGGSAIAFLIFLFIFKWYGVSSSASIGGVSYSSSANGWHTFTNSRWIWIITIVVALGAVAISAGVLELKSPVQPSVLVAGLGALSVIFIVYRILDHPSAGASGTIAGVHYSASAGIKIGIWLGLIAAVGVTYGGYLGMQDEGTSLADVREQASGAFSNLSAATSAGPTPASAGSADPAAPPIPPAAAAPAPEPPDATSA